MKFSVVAGTTYHFQMDHLDNPQTTANTIFQVQLKYLPPTAAEVSVSGRVTDSLGRGITHVRVSLTDMSGNARTAITGTFGYYRFDAVAAGQSYTLQAASKRFLFANNPRIVSIVDNLLGENFVEESGFP
jgi:hypothetical protein